jgi:hypothetical protein
MQRPVDGEVTGNVPSNTALWAFRDFLLSLASAKRSNSATFVSSHLDLERHQAKGSLPV